MSSTVYVIRANDTITPHGVLYGDAALVHRTRAEAEAEAARLNADAVWGRDGDLTAEDVGLSYEVYEEDIVPPASYVLAVGDDADEWDRYHTRAEAEAAAELLGSSWSIWHAGDYDGDGGNGPVSRRD